jgi:hypothetical protein
MTSPILSGWSLITPRTPILHTRTCTTAWSGTCSSCKCCLMGTLGFSTCKACKTGWHHCCTALRPRRSWQDSCNTLSSLYPAVLHISLAYTNLLVNMAFVPNWASLSTIPTSSSPHLPHATERSSGGSTPSLNPRSLSQSHSQLRSSTLVYTPATISLDNLKQSCSKRYRRLAW